MSTDHTYNGWTNWETWNTNLWMTNEEPLYDEARAIVAEYIDDGRETDESTARTVDTYGAGKALREWWEELFYPGAPDERQTGPVSDAWSATLDAVNWDEIAEGLAEE